MHEEGKSSIYRGVSLHSATRKFRANIKIRGQKIALGAYFSEREAAAAFDRAAIKYRGSRAEVNFPEEVGSGVQAGSVPKKRKKVKRAAKEEDDEDFEEELASPATVRLATGERTSKRIRCQIEEKRSLEPGAKVKIAPPQEAEEFLDLSDAELNHVLDEVDGALPKLLSDFQNFAASSSTPFAERKSASLRSDISSDDEAQGNEGFYMSSADASMVDADSGSPKRGCSPRSHGLDILAARGLLLPAHIQQSRYGLGRPSVAPLQLLKRQAVEQRASMGFRQLLVARAMMSAAEADKEASGEVEAVTFSDSPTPASKDMWWRTQLQNYLLQQEEPAI